jgi:hypothetical protein
MVVIRVTEEEEEGELFVVGLLDGPLLLDHSGVPQSRLMPLIHPFVGGTIRLCAQHAMNVIVQNTTHASPHAARHAHNTYRQGRGC